MLIWHLDNVLTVIALCLFGLYGVLVLIGWLLDRSMQHLIRAWHYLKQRFLNNAHNPLSLDP